VELGVEVATVEDVAVATLVDTAVVEESAPATDDGPAVSPTPMRIVATETTVPSLRRKVTP
jgi:hypothetical protein